MTAPRTHPAAPASTPEATGGVGTVLEFEFSALALAALILHEPLLGLGAPWIPSAVAAQQEASSPVDDIVVTADARGDRMTYYVASRRLPVIGPSSRDTVKMFADFLRFLRERAGSFTDGSALIGLAVAGPHTPATEVDRLTAIAAEQHHPAAFRAAVATRSGPLRTRLALVDEIVAEAAGRLVWPDAVRGEQDWSWFLLRNLRVAQPRLEREGPDLVYVVGRLAGLVGADDPMTCWQRLCKIAQTVAGTAGAVDEATVRKQLRGHVRVASAPALADARAVLDAREADLRARTPGLLVGPSAAQRRELALERGDARHALAERLATTGAAGGALVVRGEPNVGKSTLVLHAVDDVRAGGGAVTALSLRDLRGQLTALEGQLRHPLRRVFAGSAVAPERLLVLDGAEAVQEGAAADFSAVVSAAVDAGLGVVAVCRDDAAAAVSAQLAQVAAQNPQEFLVTSLNDADVDVVLSAFDALARLRDRRSRWLLGRVGLAAMLLRGGTGLRTGPLAEADVFDACWRGWVRRDEQRPPGEPTPDERERAMLALARHELGSEDGNESPGALASLRSDGLLLPFGPGASWRPSEAFTDDVVRDLATSRLLLTTGVRMLASASAPRWALHAGLVACQGQILRGADELVPAMAAIVSDCAAVAESFGERWSDLPWEALLTSPLASRLLNDPDAALTGKQRTWLAELLRVARQRFVNATIGDPLALEPLVDWLARQRLADDPVPREAREPADEVTLAWLRGLAIRPDATIDDDARAVRQRVRDALRSRASDDRVDPKVLLGTALLGGDLEQQDRDLLVGLAAERPGFLADVVEDVAVARALAESNAKLLADLALAYYRADRRDRHAGWADDGVRRHTHLPGFGAPAAAWYFGPFWALLQADLTLGLATINALLDHAVTDGSARPTRSWDLLGTGPRDYFGDGSTYTWYRGMGVCPTPCTSALLAVERLADSFVRAGVPVRRVASHLLASATALPMVALVVGFVVRHFDAVTDELDDILATPELWDLEIARATHEHTGMLMHHDEHDIAGRDRRRWSLRDVAMTLVANAKLNADDAALQRLERVHERLLAAAAAEADSNGRLSVTVRMNAGFLVADSYSLQPLPDSTVVVQYDEPADVTAELAEERVRLARVETVLGLSNGYHLRLTPPHGNDPPDIDADRLVADLAAVRSLGDAPLDDREYQAGVAVAAAVVRAAACGVDLAAAGIPLDGILWAASAVLGAAEAGTQYPLAIEESLYSSGADRVAASAVPSLLRRGFADTLTACGADAPMDAEDVQYVATALTGLATSRFHEVRRFVALALREVWAEPCHDLLGACLHRRAWTAVEEAAADVALAPWHDGRRDYTRLNAPVFEALLSADEKDLARPRLSAALAMAASASTSAACLAADAVPLRDALLDAWARTSVHYGHEGYSTRPEEHVLVADALLATADADPELLPRAISLLGGLTEATSDLLDACCTAAAYSRKRRDQIGRAWPTLMAGVLEHPAPAEPDTRHRGSRERSNAVAALIPSPQPVTFDEDMDATIRAAAEGWPRVADLTDLIDRWLPLAGSGRAVDNLVRLLRTAPRDEQIDRGLPWIRSLVVRPGRTVTDSFTVVGWLQSIRGSRRLAEGSRHHYDVLVDALATAGSLAAQQLQAQDE